MPPSTKQNRKRAFYVVKIAEPAERARLIKLDTSAMRQVVKERGKPYHAALFLDLNPNIVRRVLEEKFSPKAHAALIEKGYIPRSESLEKYEAVKVCPKCGKIHKQISACSSQTRRQKTRHRISAELSSKKDREKLTLLAIQKGFDSWTEFVNAIKDNPDQYLK